ncbi:MAG: 4Fe-4S dicluster domain-containing protein [Promethearchaeota archaeon]
MADSRKNYMDCCDWSQCTLCGECLMQCPVLELDKETAVKEVKQLLDGKHAENVFNKCTLCFNCNQYCPEGLRPHELILQRVIENRKGKIKNYLLYMVNGMPGGDMFNDYYAKMSAEEKKILEKWAEIPSAGSKDILWVGCLGKTICKSLDNSEILKELPKFGPPDVCCGELAYRLIGWECYTEVVERILKRFEKLDIKRMVCYCASCYNFLNNVLPTVYGKKLPFELISMYEWLLEKYEKGEIKLKKPLKYKKGLAISESCYVSELGSEFQSALRKIYEAAGANLVELPHHGENNLSCGMVSIGRNMSLINGALKTSKNKYKDFKATKSKDIALNCPGCYLGLKGTNYFKLPWRKVKKLHYMPDELLEAFGDKLEPPLADRMGGILKTLLKKKGLFKKSNYPVPHIPIE